MFHKRQKDYAAGEPKSKRFRHNVADLMLPNEISGQRAQELCQDALASGSTGVEDLAKGATPSSSIPSSSRTHTCFCGRGQRAFASNIRALQAKQGTCGAHAKELQSS